jgi:tRNA pseudouridine32 synthase / 23S rRNA pseudouridine746 synthase
MAIPSFFTPFKTSIEGYTLPEQFTFPFNYQPHPLSLLAAEELQDYIKNQKEWQDDLDFNNGIGKMFGVLVVQNEGGELGYISAFSGKLAGENHHARFVPPVFDILTEKGFFKKGEAEINPINSQVEALEKDAHFIKLKEDLQTATLKSQEEIAQFRQLIKEEKAQRTLQREQAQKQLSLEELTIFQEDLNKKSVKNHFQLKDLIKNWKQIIADIEAQIDPYFQALNLLKEERKNKSAALQQRIFESYTFLNQAGEKKNLTDIFPPSKNIFPPAGAGECAAPKLLQYAFLHRLKLIAMAEFWWGQSPTSEIRKQGHFYPACKSKCEPILGHMLHGIDMGVNPMLINPAEGKDLTIVYEDDYLVVVNKPEDFLSVPGKKVDDSVLTRMKNKYPQATGPMVVHRLDMSTSGLLLIAKTKEVHQNLQNQFLKRKIKKRYVALLEGKMTHEGHLKALETEGFIDLPIRVDLDDRPRQLVCYEHGRFAQTKWQLIEHLENQTRVHFYPLTGRTHQLRVHAAHPKGLNMPIVGDDLYGKRADRLYLHAEYLEFTHPISEKVIQVEAKADF